MRSLCVSALLAALAVSCSDDPVPERPDRDAGTPADGGDVGDAGTPDGGTPIVDLCDPIGQTGCAAPTTKCVVEARPGEGAHCVEPNQVEKRFGEVCAVAGECAPGLACVTTSTAGATCVQLCNPNDGAGCEVLAGAYICRDRLRDTNFGACSPLPPVCDPVTQRPCDERTEACQPFQMPNDTFELRCRPAGTGRAGNDCSQGCAAGFVCVRHKDGQTRCRQICEPSTTQCIEGMCRGELTGLDLTFCQ